MFRLRPIEIFLLQFIFYLLLWLWNDYLATLLSGILAVVCFSILIISLITEWIEPSKVPRWYFWLMLASILAPVLAALVFVGLMGGELNWINE
ncbi:MAG: hypothetical protein AAGG75_25365 [Bacteroidota bacterium]